MIIRFQFIYHLESYQPQKWTDCWLYQEIESQVINVIITSHVCQLRIFVGLSRHKIIVDIVGCKVIVFPFDEGQGNRAPNATNQIVCVEGCCGCIGHRLYTYRKTKNKKIVPANSRPSTRLRTVKSFVLNFCIVIYFISCEMRNAKFNLSKWSLRYDFRS